MSTREYIGARYVPKFVGTYDSSTMYEALSVVDNGAGTSYISKKNVPAGTPLTNQEYWFVYGASSGAILSLQSRMDTAEDNIIDLQTAAFSEDALYHNLLKLEGKKIMIIGDSLTDNTTFPPNWVQLIINCIDVHQMNITVNTDNCINGSSFAGFASDLTRFDSYTTDEFDIVIISLGINDYQGQFYVGQYNANTVDSPLPSFSALDMSGAMNLLLRKMREKFPHAIQYGTIPHRSGRAIENKKLPLSFYRYAIGTIYQYYGTRIIDLSSMPMYAPAIFGDFAGYSKNGDLLHPSEEYSPVMANYITAQIISGGSNSWKLSADEIRYEWTNPDVTSPGLGCRCVFYSDGRIHVKGVYTKTSGEVTANYPYELAETVYVVRDAISYATCASDQSYTDLLKVYNNKVCVVPSHNTLTEVDINTVIQSKYPMNDWYNIAD